jgi:septation ring formation regulator EzrA
MPDYQLDPNDLRKRFKIIENKRDSLLRLLEQPDLGTLRIDVNQAIEEIDDLIDEFKRTFPETELG